MFLPWWLCYHIQTIVPERWSVMLKSSPTRSHLWCNIVMSYKMTLLDVCQTDADLFLILTTAVRNMDEGAMTATIAISCILRKPALTLHNVYIRSLVKLDHLACCGLPYMGMSQIMLPLSPSSSKIFLAASPLSNCFQHKNNTLNW